MKKIFSIFIFLLCAGTVFAANPPRVNKTLPFHKGINFTLWLDGNEPHRVANFGRQDFEDIRSLGVDCTRLYIRFEEYSSGEPDYIIPDWLWKNIDDAVAWCTELKMYMIIDFHNDCDGDSKTRPDVEKILTKIWPQIANRYKDSSEYIIYEIMNEPHFRSGNLEADISKWNKIQGKILKLIRTIDTKHTVIVGAESWNSVTALLKLPDYKDYNIIYNFHDYTPMLFSHQGASWTIFKYLTGVPFPYDKNKMPPFPKDPGAKDLRWDYDNYERDSSENVLCKPLDEAVKFANKRGVALMCNEWGVSMQYADNAERINWYRMKAKWMDDRNIVRMSHDYKDLFGIFNSPSHFETFPQDVNVELIEAMGYKMPQGVKPRSKNWMETSYKNGEYVIYKDGVSKNTLCNPWLKCVRKNEFTSFGNKPDDNGGLYISVPSAEKYNAFMFEFNKSYDFTPFVNKNLCLEFEVKTTQKNFRLDVYFMDNLEASMGKKGFEWRATKSFTSRDGLNDGKWHKVRILLKDMKDGGAWNDLEKKWYNGEGLFNWNRIHKLAFDFIDGLTEECCIRNIVVK
ncbi:MAG: glycoside hydrolase family 5 protein [Treponema sp.]|uniref:glycoside hydrolase family 5 protein n=1 Tax=Treponema sp. TaxID=166 RepID=UPI00298E2B4A|nr:cellulase family glycosylhydrolase [Treponema sp.]MCR5387563.1 glycoside hydrolase family 5 protein [Treponema sp.]